MDTLISLLAEHGWWLFPVLLIGYFGKQISKLNAQLSESQCQLNNLTRRCAQLQAENTELKQRLGIE